MNQSELEANTCHRRQARENACEQVAIGLSFTSDWWRKWREIFQPITERSKAKPKQNANYFRHSNENRSITNCGTPATRSSDFVSYAYDYGPNWTPLSPINII